jgi:hypothetical protein
MNEIIPVKDYKLVEFTKDDKDIIKRIKEYSIRNCRKEISTKYITSTLNNFDYGISYFRTEILKKTNSIKNRPCAFACVKYQENDKLCLLLICSIQNDDKLGTQILNEVFSFAKNKGFAKITLECDEKNVKFYSKFNFNEDGNTSDDMVSMTKNLN